MPAMLLSTAKHTTQIPTTYVPRMSEKSNPAVNTLSDATLQPGMGPQGRVQCEPILLDKWFDALVLVPIRAK